MCAIGGAPGPRSAVSPDHFSDPPNPLSAVNYHLSVGNCYAMGCIGFVYLTGL
jgi:hypothetical protein